MRSCQLCHWIVLSALFVAANALGADYIRDLQTEAIKDNKSAFGHWGADPDNYKAWSSHSNRLIPVYTYGTLNGRPGVDLKSYQGENSPYRSETQLQRIYGRTPVDTLDSKAEFFDQTNIFDIQQAALKSGKKHVFLIIFDGMDWQTTRAASIYKTQKIAYTEGRGTGLHFQDYNAGGTSQFGYMCTSPHNEGTKVNTTNQTVLNPGGALFGGYNIAFGGPNSWTPGSEPLYPISKNEKQPIHAYTDSSSSATSMTAGIKTYNNAVNVDYAGQPVPTIAHFAQEMGFSVGAVTSVPISHATPAASYAHNVHRDDYQDLTRDLLGLKSVAHPEKPLQGLDVLIGCGFGVTREKDSKKAADNEGAGSNFVPGNAYLADEDRQTVDTQNGGKYVVSIRTEGLNGRKNLLESAQSAANSGKRLFGFFGFGSNGGHLPFATANGDWDPTVGRGNKSEAYTPQELEENPTLSDMASAAITVLSRNPKGFWLMIEPGDVDWANHDNNIDNSIGAVFSGDAAVKTVTDWVEKNSNWNESLVIVTADHGHYLILEQPELLIAPK